MIPANDADEIGISPPSLTLDWEAYAPLLNDPSISEDQKRELIETLWSIVLSFVDLGFDVHPVQQVCGQGDDPLNIVGSDLISLTTKEREDT